MIVNNQSNGILTMDTNQRSPGQCENFFLKRKHGLNEDVGLQIDNGDGNVCRLGYVVSQAVVSTTSSLPPLCKKRTLQQNSTASSSNCYIMAAAASSSDNSGSFSHNLSAEEHTNNNSDMQFNLIANAFMNDLFAYDNDMVVPLPVPNSIHEATTSSGFTPGSGCGSDEQDFANDPNWQAEDLLELDHRYNSGLQLENIHSQHVTIPSPPTNNQPQHQLQSQPIQQQQHSNYVPQKQQIHRSHLSTVIAQQSHPQCRQSNSPATITGSIANGGGANNNLQFTSNADANSESDFEDKNLSWLFNFKLDELPHMSPDVGNNNCNQMPTAEASLSSSNSSKISSVGTAAAAATTRERSKSPKIASAKMGRKFEELVMEITAEMDANEMMAGENVIIEDNLPKMPKKPPFTYTELIEYALEDKGELTVSGIYQWISDRFPFYKSNDDRWKNSVRHNLSINPHFRKGIKAPQGAGHLWTISSGDSEENVLAWEHKKQRLDLFFKMEALQRERMLQHQQHNCNSMSPVQCNTEHPIYDEAAVAAAAITQEMLSDPSPIAVIAESTNNNNHHSNCHSPGCERVRSRVHELPFNDLITDEELRKTAGQILNGIHRDVEVQAVNSIISTYHDNLLDSDYLNPVNKDVAVNESGLSNTVQSASSSYYVTELEPGVELGVVHMPHHAEEEVLFNDEFNLSYFGYNPGSDIVA